MPAVFSDFIKHYKLIINLMGATQTRIVNPQ